MLAEKNVINDLWSKAQSFVNQFCSLMAELYKRIIELSTKNSIILDFYRSVIPDFPGDSLRMGPSASAAPG
jgi:hypothetical protein